MNRRRGNLQRIFDSQIQNLALTLRPNSVLGYRTVASGFLNYLGASYPQIDRLSQLRRDPHILGWLRTLCQKIPPYKNGTRLSYLIRLRRLLQDLASNRTHSCKQDLIVPDDLPPLDEYLPKPLSPEDDRLLDQELRKNPDLARCGLLLLRATGMRIGECISLTTDCLRHLELDQWALRVPLGKLHNERWLPVDDQIRKIIARLLALRKLALNDASLAPQDLLFPQPYGHRYACESMRRALATLARRAGCSTHITPHQLRHTFATEMLRAGMSLPALKELLGHKSIRMTLRYIDVSQNDLQQQYLQARQKLASLYVMPKGAIPKNTATPKPLDIRTICDSLAAVRHMLEMYRRRLANEQVDKKLKRLTTRVAKIAKKLYELDSTPK